MNAPMYQIAKHLIDAPNRNLILNNHYNVKNSVNMANDLIKLKINENHKMMKYDVKDLHIKIRINETRLQNHRFQRKTTHK
jgi:hypothetical protein